MANVALITPTSSITYYCTGRPIQMALAHLVDQIPEYHNAYQNIALSSYIVLDNGLWEINKSYPIDLLWSLASSIQAQEIVLPDVLFNCDETIIAGAKALEEVRKHKMFSFKYAFVLQGNNLKEYYKSLVWAIQQPEIYTIMFPKSSENKIPNGRAGMLGWIRDMFPEVYRTLYCKRIHLLGVWHNPLEIANCVSAHPRLINAVDTALPFHMAYKLQKIDKTFGLANFDKSKRPEDYFEYKESMEDTITSEFNVKMLDCIAKE